MFGFACKKKERIYPVMVGDTIPRPTLKDELVWRSIDPDGIVHNSDQSLTSVISFRGPDMASSTRNELIRFYARINSIVKSLSAGYVISFEAQRHFANEYKRSIMPKPLLQKMEDEREAYYNGDLHFETQYYLILNFVPPEKIKSQLIDFWIENSQKDKVNTIYSEVLKGFIETRSVVYEALKEQVNDIKLLSPDEMVTYLHSTVSDEYYSLKAMPNEDIRDYIVDSSLLGGFEPKLGSKHMRIISVLSFPGVLHPSTFDILNDLKMEYRWVARYICFSKEDSEKMCKEKSQRHRQSAKTLPAYVREALTKVSDPNALDANSLLLAEDATEAGIASAKDYVSFGYFSMNIIVLDFSAENADKKADILIKKIRQKQFNCKKEKLNAVPAWFGTLPGHWRSNVRNYVIDSLSFCRMAPIAAMWSGDKDNEHLQGPVLIYTDSSGNTPFRLSLHYKDVGHTLVVGPTGSGKSVLLNILEAHFAKYPKAKIYIFDKAASSRALTLGVGGNFYNIAAEGKNELSFQPLANIDEESEIKWAKEWLLNFIKQQNVATTPLTDKHVWDALISLSELPKNQRTISVFVTMVQDQIIRLACTQLTKKGSYGRLFDNDKDFSGIGHWQVFEMETLMNTPAIVPATLDYLFHRIERNLRNSEGPALMVLDECWLFFDNPVFAKKLEEYFRDMRKKNTSIVIATQNLADIAQKPALLNAINSNCPNKIFLPNLNATNKTNAEMYKLFACNEAQLEIIANMEPKKEYYYCNPYKGNRVFDLALRPIEIAFVTATGKSDQMEIERFIDTKQGKFSSDDFVSHWLRYKGNQETSIREEQVQWEIK